MKRSILIVTVLFCVVIFSGSCNSNDTGTTDSKSMSKDSTTTTTDSTTNSGDHTVKPPAQNGEF